MSGELRQLVDHLAEKIGDGSEHIPGERCVKGLAQGTAGPIAPVTDPNKAKAESAVKAAARSSAIADAQTKCDAGTCSKAGAKCTFVKMIEASSIDATPVRNAQGRIDWTASVRSFDVWGPCICVKAAEDDERDGLKGRAPSESPAPPSRTHRLVFEVGAAPKIPNLQTPCEGGRLQVRHAYSTCIGGTWHVVEDDYYECPPDMTSRSFRVMDIDTEQPCSESRPSPIGSVFKGLDPTCQSPVKIGAIVLSQCPSGTWEHATYDIFECSDHSKRVATPATRIEVTTIPCTSDPGKPPV